MGRGMPRLQPHVARRGGNTGNYRTQTMISQHAQSTARLNKHSPNRRQLEWRDMVPSTLPALNPTEMAKPSLRLTGAGELFFRLQKQSDKLEEQAQKAEEAIRKVRAQRANNALSLSDEDDVKRKTGVASDTQMIDSALSSEGAAYLYYLQSVHDLDGNVIYYDSDKKQFWILGEKLQFVPVRVFVEYVSKNGTCSIDPADSIAVYMTLPALTLEAPR